MTAFVMDAEAECNGKGPVVLIDRTHVSNAKPGERRGRRVIRA